jgi:hypothetical protein
VAPSAARRRRERRYGVLYVVRALSLEPARPVGFEGYAMECPAGRRRTVVSVAFRFSRDARMSLLLCYDVGSAAAG